MATQTGSIDLTASNSVKLAAEAGWQNDLEDYYTKSEIDVTVEGINSTVSTKVGEDEVISSINQSAESVSINANKVNLQGAVTISDLASDTQNATLNSKLSVGGRNLLAKTKELTSGVWVYDGATRGDNVALIATSGKRIYQLPSVGYWTWTTGTSYAVSVDARADASTVLEIDAFGASPSGMMKQFTVGTSWERYVFVFTATTVNTGSLSFYRKGSANTTLYLRRPKLEKGNTATDWTSAPEDVDSAIEAVPQYKVRTTTYSYPLSSWLTYAAEGAQDSWSKVSDVKVGDTVLLKGTNRDTGDAVYLLMTVDELTSSGRVNKATSHGLVDPTAGQRADNAAKTATSYVTEITGQNGIMVHPSTDQTTGVRVTSDVDILRSGTSVANYGTTARIGTLAGKHVSIDSDSVDLMDGNASLATFGANDTHIGMSGTGNVYMANDSFRMSATTSEWETSEPDALRHVTQEAVLDSTMAEQVLTSNCNIQMTNTQEVNEGGSGIATVYIGAGIGPTNASDPQDAVYASIEASADLGGGSDITLTADRVTHSTGNGRNSWSTPAGTVLWSASSGWAMAANVTATLDYPVTSCPSGIVLHWQAYASGATQNYAHVYTFIPKQHVVTNAGGGVTCQLAHSAFSQIGTKYVYVNDGSIVGNAANTQSGTANGITYNNGYWVLTQVISA